VCISASQMNVQTKTFRLPDSGKLVQ
jgi:hypothetical protein